MKLLPALFLLVSALPVLAAEGQPWVTYEGKDGPGKGKHIVLLAGDEEYRSEEALPQLAKILSEKHGFKCTVSFSINPKTGEIDPNTKDNQPGIEALASADLCITSLRFRTWPEEQMKHFADYLAAGKPFIGLRTSTHAFNGVSGIYKGLNEFGKQVLGEKWVSHWGKHKAEATRGIIEPSAKDDPLLRGVTDIFGDTDVYEAYPPADAKILVRGQVVNGMRPEDAPAVYSKKRSTDKAEQPVNDPMMPVVWRRDYRSDTGKTNQILCTTMGSATDLLNESLRRLIVNAAYAFTGLEVPAKADVSLVGDFKPTDYGFNSFIKGVKPADHATR
ncbi:MAG TPA: ThuA domain-containing protein [Chthoniobacteraceae bacterium]|nr:ThuA domain-containing protein [Chthoniobacteraceae bacterium]